MQLFEGYTVDELDRVLTVSRVAAAILAILAAVAITVNQWVTHRIANIQREERTVARLRMAVAEGELSRMRKDVTEVASSLDKLTAERKLTAKQREVLLASLKAGAKGKILVTFLTVEWDAEPYAKQIVALFRDAGFEVSLSDYLWVDFEQDGEFLVLPGADSEAANNVLRSFAAAGVPLRLETSPLIIKEMKVKDDTCVFVVSNRQ